MSPIWASGVNSEVYRVPTSPSVPLEEAYIPSGFHIYLEGTKASFMDWTWGQLSENLSS